MTLLNTTPAMFIDLIIVSLLLYILLVWFKRSQAGMVLAGLGMASGIYLLARQFQLVLTTTVFQWFFTAILIIVVVIFQEEIRSFFERMAVVSFRKNYKKGKKKTSPRLHEAEISVLTRAVFDMAKDRVGALIVLRGIDPLERHIRGGVLLHGEISEAIIGSIFDSSSAGHDGAVIIEGNQLIKFACHLPLTKNLEKIEKGGTRHSAALGMSEASDAFCIVVSEERGAVSFAHRGELILCKTKEDLENALEKFYQVIFPKPKKFGVAHWLVDNVWEKIIAVGVTFLLWFVVIYGSEIIYESYNVPIQVESLSEQLTISEMEPNALEIAFSGPRRMFYQIDAEDIHLILDGSQWKKGTKSLRVIDSNVNFPADLVLRSVGPTRDLKIVIEPKKSQSI